jgi:hypothetical protein
MTTPWDMARVASRRQLPKPRKMMGPVGEAIPDWTLIRNGVVFEGRPGPDQACHNCGYHVCSCEDAHEPSPFAEALDHKIKNIMQSAELYLTAVDLGIWR